MMLSSSRDEVILDRCTLSWRSSTAKLLMVYTTSGSLSHPCILHPAYILVLDCSTRCLNLSARVLLTPLQKLSTSILSLLHRWMFAPAMPHVLCINLLKLLSEHKHARASPLAALYTLHCTPMTLSFHSTNTTQSPVTIAAQLFRFRSLFVRSYGTVHPTPTYYHFLCSR